MDETLAKWGRNLTAARLASGLTQAQFAERTGVHWSTACRWENGRTEPHRRHKARIAEVLGVPVTSLFPIDESAA